MHAPIFLFGKVGGRNERGFADFISVFKQNIPNIVLDKFWTVLYN